MDGWVSLFLQTAAKGDSVEVKYTGWVFENNTFGKVRNRVRGGQGGRGGVEGEGEGRR